MCSNNVQCFLYDVVAVDMDHLCMTENVEHEFSLCNKHVYVGGPPYFLYYSGNTPKEWLKDGEF